MIDNIDQLGLSPPTNEKKVRKRKHVVEVGLVAVRRSKRFVTVSREEEACFHDVDMDSRL